MRFLSLAENLKSRDQEMDMSAIVFSSEYKCLLVSNMTHHAMGFIQRQQFEILLIVQCPMNENYACSMKHAQQYCTNH